MKAQFVRPLLQSAQGQPTQQGHRGLEPEWTWTPGWEQELWELMPEPVWWQGRWQGLWQGPGRWQTPAADPPTSPSSCQGRP